MTIVREPGAATDSGDWLSIHEASALVGVSVATLRRWCDAGDVRCFTTPGGHRRFERAAVLGLLPGRSSSRPSVGCQGETAIRIVRACRRELRASGKPDRDMPQDARRCLRDHGRELVAALVDVLDQPRTDMSAASQRADRSAASCGRVAAEVGMDLQQAVELFLYFRTRFLREIAAIARRRGVDASGAVAVLELASDSVDGLLPAMIGGFEAAEVNDRPGRPGIRPG